jgi:hypothetical protein
MVASYKGFFLRATPLFELAFIFDSVGDAIKPLREYKHYRSASRGVAAKGPGIVLSNSYFQCGARCPDVEASISAPKNIKKGTFHGDLPIQPSS